MQKLPFMVALSLCTAAVYLVASKRGDCSFTPDGRVRLANPIEWFSDSDCDVWSTVEAKKPIDSFEIDYRSSRVRLHADGDAAVIFSNTANDDFANFDEASGRIAVHSEQELQRMGYRVISGKIPKDVAAKATSLITPMRDFVGWSPKRQDFFNYMFGDGIGEKEDQQVRQYFDLDDSRTQIGGCYQRVTDAGKGWTIFHWNRKTNRDTGLSQFQSIGCIGPAQVWGQQRAEQAASLIVNALGASDDIQQHYEKFPEPGLP